MKINVIYTDATEESFDSIEDAEYGIEATVLGCDFAATVESVERINDDGTKTELGVAWQVRLRGDGIDEPPSISR